MGEHSEAADIAGRASDSDRDCRNPQDMHVLGERVANNRAHAYQIAKEEGGE
jgi:hypothetical protein